jgi:uncharacterized FlaG/YvyC family protein
MHFFTDVIGYGRAPGGVWPQTRPLRADEMCEVVTPKPLEDGDMDISSINNLAHAAAAAGTALPEPASPDQRTLIQAVKAVNASQVFGENNELTFILDRATHRAVVRIVDRTSGEVVEQIPAEYVLRIAEELKGSSH